MSLADLEAHVFDGFVGYDLLPCLTFFITASSSEAKLTGMEDDGSMQFKWSVGFSAYLWYVDVVDPTFLEGRISLKPVVELVHVLGLAGSTSPVATMSAGTVWR